MPKSGTEPYLHYTTMFQMQAATFSYILVSWDDYLRQRIRISYCSLFISNFNSFVYNIINVIRQLTGDVRFYLKICHKIVISVL